MNRSNLRRRLLYEVKILREMAERLEDIASHLEESASTLSIRPIGINRSRVYGESGGVAALEEKVRDIAGRLDCISDDMTPNTDQMTNSRYRRDYD